ncbi:hypothetical protein [Desulfosediminicola flagellatus]|uniref:hypothetical protein n=1 Tax=Desulfosediminicola flagellatus TaxID=2569541 RepID=UPI0010AB7420|nr:hypothetical protein [Desulfosediminicola flagellatus]
MSEKEAYRKRLVADIKLDEARLAQLEAKINSNTTGIRARDTDRIKAVEQRIDEGKTSLRELSRHQENTRGRPGHRLNKKGRAAWGKLQDSLQDDISTHEGEL